VSRGNYLSPKVQLKLKILSHRIGELVIPSQSICWCNTILRSCFTIIWYCVQHDTKWRIFGFIAFARKRRSFVAIMWFTSY